MSEPSNPHPTFGALVGAYGGTLLAGGWAGYIGLALAASGVLGLVKAMGGDPGASVGAALAGLAIGLPLIGFAIVRWRQTVAVYERGLVHDFLVRRRELAFAEVRDVKLITTHSRSGTTHTMEIDAQGDGSMTIVNVARLEELAAMIRNAMARGR